MQLFAGCIRARVTSVTASVVTKIVCGVTELVGTKAATRGFKKRKKVIEGADRPPFYISTMSRDVTVLADARLRRVTAKYPDCQAGIPGANFFPRQSGTAGDQAMRDASISKIARDLGNAMMARVKSRSAEDQKVVLAPQVQLVAEILDKEKSDKGCLLLD